MPVKKHKTRVAVLGGSFNPVHYGHLIAAREVLRFKAADEVWFMPCYQHAFKTHRNIAGPEHRAHMLALAMPKDKRYVVSTFEIERGEHQHAKSYTIDTLRALRKNYPSFEFYWMIGSNLVSQFSKWKDALDIVKTTRVIIVPLPGFTKKDLQRSKFFRKHKPIVLWNSIVMTNINSTLIRELAKKDQTLEFLLPEKVRAYIEENKLYR